MKGKICLTGDSLEVKLLRDSLLERGLEVLFFKKSEFDFQKIPSSIDVMVYELSYEETKNPLLVDNFFKLGLKSIVFLAERADLEDAIEFIKRGAYDFKLLSTPFEIMEKTILYALEEKKIFWQDSAFITKNPYMLKILKKLEEVAQSKAPILLVGETGTGKELLSKYIHQKSPRRFGPFIAINCAALPESLLESELFGYEKGAFSGANFRKKGKIELADKGTLLLDEITEMHPHLQSKLLRVLQEEEVDRLGGYQPIKVDIRLISTTNKNIEKEVSEGRFRSDLFYRINVITVKIPSLRERKEDIELLAFYFLEKFSTLYHKNINGFTERALSFLKNYHFPGNVRELKNMIERAVLTCEDKLIDLENIIDPFSQNIPSSYTGTNFAKNSIEVKPLSELEREAILKALEICKGNRTKAAELLGITVRTLRNKLKQYEREGLL
ncbi:sigma54 specific transcriptional regulator, Fis family [Thermodesulfobacterium geofontis OPF15]|jgi:two-component system response regulator FlrC|uniref:Sigma54 specific transcriptional regulator, Fis family n=1 Tax=Thermodesulfobacterium geofontis (strain OPF15) TaxID=795359 RepID=F8C220_THEGP|nr:sigma-54 dependent transcriptional regulator [Thermodesulfobacterium geofontis]AEH22172.1 sigma54 specific transcriptional regulator, Fis family [Thermodesulfobacterium geofontis OPF15]